MGHTPGPWRLHKWGGELTGDDTIDVLAAGDLEVCAVLPTYDDNGQPERLWATILADARLIAAAPELLAALKDLRAFVSDNLIFSPEVAVADRAIAKAEERSE